MIDIYFTDKINIILIAYDEWGKKTESAPVSVSCRYEAKNRIVRNKDGQEVTSSATIMAPSDTNIDYTSLIQLVEINGETQKRSAQKFAVLNFHNAHGFGPSHLEVYI